MSESTLTKPSWRGHQHWLSPSWQRALRTPLVIALGAALAGQLLLALWTGRGDGMAPAAMDTALLEFDRDQVSAIEIQDAERNALKLERAGDRWLLPDLADFPASTTRVEELLDTLHGLTRPLPVATSSAARTRFKVAEDAFGRRVSLRGEGGDLATLLVGDSPGFRRLFARVAGDDAIYDLRLALADLSASPDDWIDRGRLQLEHADVVRIASADWVLVKGDDGWRLEGSDQPPDAAAVDDLLTTVASLGYRAVLGIENKPEYGLDAPLLSLEIDLKDGARRVYRIGRMKDSEDYALKREDDAYYYRLAAFDLDGLLEQNASTLLGQETKQDDSEDVQASVGQDPGAEAPEPASRPDSAPAEVEAVTETPAATGADAN